MKRKHAKLLRTADFSKKVHFQYVKIIILLFICVGSFGLSGCDEWENDVVINGIKFTKFSHSSKKGYLAEDTLIQDYPCKKGFVVFYDDWSLNTFQFSEPFEFSGFVIPAKTWGMLDKEGNIYICFFSKDTEVQGYPCRGSIMGREGIQTSFHKNGKLNCFFPRKDIEIDGILCKGSVFHLTVLHNNGRLRSCTLAETTTIHGSEYKMKSKISLDREGKIVSSE